MCPAYSPHSCCLWKLTYVALIALILLDGSSFGMDYSHSQAPRISEHPASKTVTKGEPVTLNCKAVGKPEPSIEWYKDGQLVSSSGPQRMVLDRGTSLFFLSTRYGKKDSDSGVYWCVAKNELGQVTSNNATLEVAVLRDEFRAEPANTRVAAGETALLECGPPKGHPEPTVQWKKNNQFIDFNVNKRYRLVDGGNLAIQDARKIDEGRYQCIAKNVVGARESTPAMLDVHVKPYLIRGPKDETVLAGGTVEFQCNVGGDPLPDVLWKRSAGGGNMPLSRVLILEDRSLRLRDVAPEDEGEYSCLADNSVGSVTASATLVVHSPPKLVEKPPDHITIERDRDAIFVCAVAGNPRPSVFWSIQGYKTLIYPGDVFERFEAEATSEGHTILTVHNVSESDSGKVVVCSAVNQVGSDVWQSTLTVASPDDHQPPIIVHGPANQTLPFKSSATFPCQAAGNPQPLISWYKDGISIMPIANKVNVTEAGTLSIKDLEKGDGGLYTCVASSRNGKATWTASLKLDTPTNPNIAFFRSSEPSTFPGPPSKPVIVNRTETTVTLSWTRSNKVGGSSLIGYQIEMFARENSNVTNGGWVVVARRLTGNTYTQHHLLPGASYSFLVRAENSHGLSPPSPFSDTVILSSGLETKELDPVAIQLKEAKKALFRGHVVDLINAQPISSTSVKLNWQMVNSDFVEGFYIYSRSLDGALRSTSMRTVLHAGETSGSGFLFTGLAKYKRYEFFLIPYHKHIDGRPSNSRIARTVEDVPSEPPTHMEPLLLNSSSVYLKWKEPPDSSHNGVIRSYQVVVRGGSNNTVLSNVSVNAASPSLLLTNLTAGATYFIAIAAATNKGTGPFSNPLSLRLDPSRRLLLTDNIYHMYDAPNWEESDVEWISAPWFIALLGSMVAVMTLLFGAMLFVRKRQLLAKKTTLDSRSNVGMLATPLNSKSGTGLQHPISPPLSHTALLPQHDSSLWIDGAQQSSNSSCSWRLSSENSDKESSTRLLQNGSISAMPDYAEVQQNGALSTFQGHKVYGNGYEISCDNDNSLAPYATTTLVPPNARMHGTRTVQGWMQVDPQTYQTDDPPYAPSNYARNVYSDTYYFSGNGEYCKTGGSVIGVPVIVNAQGHRVVTKLGPRPPRSTPPPPSNPPPSLNFYKSQLSKYYHHAKSSNSVDHYQQISVSKPDSTNHYSHPNVPDVDPPPDVISEPANYLRPKNTHWRSTSNSSRIMPSYPNNQYQPIYNSSRSEPGDRHRNSSS
ncbi:roundabout homolog 2 [Bemisia tabaci]|uniref:roundabout homolog 2 n=1 Tax=Bemisia tabaci TaxID=7038 RepID=UPI003B284655